MSYHERRTIARIITMILFTIGRAIEDERDKMIELKAARIASYVFGAGFFLAMGSLALTWPLSVAFLILFFSLFAQFRYYRRGF